MPRHAEVPEKRRRRGGATTLNKSSYSARMLACPFTKFDKQLYRSCRFMTFRQNADLRVHFKRCHLQPPFCPTCKAVFEGSDARQLLDVHLQQHACQLSYEDDPPGITPEQCDMMGLSKQRESRSVTPEERVQGWYNMWDILFPGHPRPSSIYHENSELSERVAEARESFFGSGAVARRIDTLLRSSDNPLGGADFGATRDFLYHCITVCFDDFEGHLVHGVSGGGPGGRGGSAASAARAGRSSPRGSRGEGQVGGAVSMYSAAFSAAAGTPSASYLDPHPGRTASPFGGTASSLYSDTQLYGWPSPNIHDNVTPAASVTEHDSGVESLSLDAGGHGGSSFGWFEPEHHEGRQFPVTGSYTGVLPYQNYAYPSETAEDQC